jgi:hypothetical protein
MGGEVAARGREGGLEIEGSLQGLQAGLELELEFEFEFEFLELELESALKQIKRNLRPRKRVGGWGSDCNRSHLRGAAFFQQGTKGRRRLQVRLGVRLLGLWALGSRHLLCVAPFPLKAGIQRVPPSGGPQPAPAWAEAPLPLGFAVESPEKLLRGGRFEGQGQGEVTLGGGPGLAVNHAIAILVHGVEARHRHSLGCALSRWYKLRLALLAVAVVALRLLLLLLRLGHKTLYVPRRLSKQVYRLP